MRSAQTPTLFRARPAVWAGLSTEAAAAAAVFAALALLPLAVSGYPIYILPQYMLYGVLAMSLGLLWGCGGILSFGQAAFFALGAYAMGLAIKWELGGNPAYVGLLASLVLGAGLAALVGYFLFSAGARAVYFVLVTLALSIIVEQITISQSDVTGGYNGMFIPRMSLTLGRLTLELSDDVGIYYLIWAVTLAIYALLRVLLRTPFGKVLVAIRENEDRAISLGFNTALYKTGAFAVSGAMACLAGALYGTHANFVSPSLAGVLFSTQVVVWVAIGGRESRRAARRGRRRRTLQLPDGDHAGILAARPRRDLRHRHRCLQGRDGRRSRAAARPPQAGAGPWLTCSEPSV
jgi:urea transport system permease protein